MRPDRAVTRAWLLLASWTVSSALAAVDPGAPPPPSAVPPADKSPDADDGLAMTTAVACRAIAGYEDYEPLPDAALTADEKLLVYYRPLRYRIDRKGTTSRLHLTQDAQVRRRGEKPVLLRKEKLLDYDFKSESTPNPVFLRNTISLKGLKPGEYDLDIILHDALAERSSVTQTLAFRVVAAVLPKAEGESDQVEPKPAPPPTAKPKVKAKRPGRRSIPPRP